LGKAGSTSGGKRRLVGRQDLKDRLVRIIDGFQDRNGPVQGAIVVLLEGVGHERNTLLVSCSFRKAAGYIPETRLPLLW
jgi:hypothetical protein